MSGIHASWTKRSNSLIPTSIAPGDVVGIGIHSGNALRGYEVGRAARERGAWVVFGGIHATLYPDEAPELGAAHAVVKGDGDRIWPTVIADCQRGAPLAHLRRRPRRRRLDAQGALGPAAADRYMWASVQTVRGCPKHCSFCSVWRTDGQKPRVRASDAVDRRDRRTAPHRASASSRWPTTTSIRSRSRICGWRIGAPTRVSSNELQGHPRRALRADGAAGEAAARTWSSSPRSRWKRPRIRSSSTRCARRTSRARWSASNRSRPRGLKDVYKDFNFAGDELVDAAADVPRARRARARLVHLRAAVRPAGDLRRDGGDGAARRRHVRAVRDADAVSRHDRLRALGREDGDGRSPDRRHSDHAPLADSAGAAARRCTRRIR